ncbi:hypothetical protein C8R47DRAFT_123320 [Mycena vitilis]|nr:hypothetical protein C8R47DRAFT_123320 [Mycena vitilis]
MLFLFLLDTHKYLLISLPVLRRNLRSIEPKKPIQPNRWPPAPIVQVQAFNHVMLRYDPAYRLGLPFNHRSNSYALSNLVSWTTFRSTRTSRGQLVLIGCAAPCLSRRHLPPFPAIQHTHPVPARILVPVASYVVSMRRLQSMKLARSPSKPNRFRRAGVRPFCFRLQRSPLGRALLQCTTIPACCPRTGRPAIRHPRATNRHSIRPRICDSASPCRLAMRPTAIMDHGPTHPPRCGSNRQTHSVRALRIRPMRIRLHHRSTALPVCGAFGIPASIPQRPRHTFPPSLARLCLPPSPARRRPPHRNLSPIAFVRFIDIARAMHVSLSPLTLSPVRGSTRPAPHHSSGSKCARNDLDSSAPTL